MKSIDTLLLGVVHSQSFLDVIQWWKAQKEMLPAAHYQMAMDYLGNPATLTPSERVNSMAGREFTTARQSLSFRNLHQNHVPAVHG